MKAATTNVLIVMGASVFGLLLAMNQPQDIRVDGAATAQMASAGNSADLVSSVDWSKIKLEPAVTTF
jgi:hypothetical protein